MAKTKISDNINMLLAALIAVKITYWYPEYAVYIWLIFIAVGIIKFIGVITQNNEEDTS